MIKIKDAFKNHKAFIPFIVAGDPDLEHTEKFIVEMAKAGADLVEIGVPFSDPVAEGTVIQAASKTALNAGTTTDKIFDMAKKTRTQVDIPLVLMTYVNPIFVYGKEKFFAKCKECGICGVIVPDLPYEEKDEILNEANACDVEVVSLIAPTSENRIGMIASEAQGFVYCVSSLGVTGVRSEIKTDVKSIVDIIRRYTDIPVAVGFGIATPEQAYDMAKISDGAIVGSAIVRIVDKYGKNAAPYLFDYVKSMKEAISKT
ncbi:Tryptophan synthase alpha chain [Megamonas hypermegale]|uniref:Tryptophan synthase alpha chain n=1 Tax=Megamonas hypermegale TaxID=158847 RepID=A0A239U300_9FIRM|nr:tryptophan synthase subunit alpha [Megamonas hypermegale]SNV04242.1 Tryptophan synthase alpha chain [Megamonas hypermegale]